MNTPTKTEIQAKIDEICESAADSEECEVCIPGQSDELFRGDWTMRHWTKLSKTVYVGKVGPTTYWVKQSGKNWMVEDDCGGAWGNFKTAAEAMLAVEEMPS